MAKLNVLVDLFFKDCSWGERVKRIADCGYSAVETWQGTDAAALLEMGRAGQECGVELVGIVANSPVDEAAAPVNCDNLATFLEQVDRCSDNALAAGCRQGIVTTGPAVNGKSYYEQRRALVDALRAAGELALAKGFLLNLEPLNLEVDHAGYFLESRNDTVAIIKEVQLDSVKVLYDIYHMAIVAGNQTAFIEANIEAIGHFHVAGVPGRREVFTSEVNYPFLLRRIDQAGYHGYIGLEYMAQLESRESLTRTLTYLRS